ncbi:MAG: DUF2244 domain-containing protein [Pseudomonadota bacterium]
MVRLIRADAPGELDRIEVLANLSLSLDRLTGFFLLLSTVTLLVALWPTIMGFWPIMAVAVVHLAIVGWCFRLAWRAHWAKQEIRVGQGHTTVHCFSRRQNEQIELPTQWMRVVVEQESNGPRVYLAVHDRRHEIGAFIPAEERIEAASLLRATIGEFSAWNQSVRAHAT